MANNEKAKNGQTTETLQEETSCLVIMPFSDPKGYEVGHFRKVYDQILAPAIEKAGFTPYRIDENVESTMIQGKLLEQLINAPLVLCDLSSKNPNVLYELGIRHAFDKPVVLVQEKGQEHIFDIAGLTTTPYRKERLYDEVLEDQEAIAEAVRQTAEAKKFSMMSLIQIAPANTSQSKALSEDDRLGVILSDISERMRRIEAQVSNSTFDSNYVAESDGAKRRNIARANLRMRVSMARDAVSSYNNGDRLEPAEVMRIGSLLQDAIEGYGKYRVREDMVSNEAEYYIHKLRCIIEEQDKKV